LISRTNNEPAESLGPSAGPTDPGQDMRHLGTVEPLWTLFDLTPGGRPQADEQIEYGCCHRS
jgi:predicted dithiol-disulfide oxidoreductase (DUF899 family)